MTKKKFSVLCPVHHVWAFEVEATDNDDALRVFKESNVTRLPRMETHDLWDSLQNILDPIEVRAEFETNEDDEADLEIDTGYFKFLATQGVDPSEQEIDPATNKPVPYWYLVEAGIPVSQMVCATSEAEARSKAVGDSVWEVSAKRIVDSGNIVGVKRQDKATDAEYEECS